MSTIGRLQPLALIDRCIGSKIWVILKVCISCMCFSADTFEILLLFSFDIS